MSRAARPRVLLLGIAWLVTAGSAACAPQHASALGNLPIVEIPATAPEGRAFAFVITGDGDLAPFVRGVARGLAARGYPVAALEARHYFSRRKTPARTAADVARVLRHYLAAWDKDSVVLVGYSRGAEVLPFAVTRLPDDLRERIRLLALLSPATRTNFQFHLTDLIHAPPRSTDLPTLPELERLADIPMVCLYGEGERDSVCPRAAPGLMRVQVRPGGHLTRDSRPALVLIDSALSPPRSR